MSSSMMNNGGIERLERIKSICAVVARGRALPAVEVPIDPYRYPWQDTIVDDILSEIRESKRQKSDREIRLAGKKEAIDGLNARLRRMGRIAIKTGYYNRIDADNFEKFAEEEARTASNGEWN